MARAVLVLVNADIRKRAHAWIDAAEEGTRIEFKGPRRTLPQNARFWAMLTDIASQLLWHGQALTPDEWRLLFLDALGRETRVVPSLDGTGVVDIGRSSSDLDKAEMSDAMEIIAAFGAEHEVTFFPDRPPKDRRK